MSDLQEFTWNSEVNADDLDFQDIVNNAVYLQYFDQARIHLLSEKNTDVKLWHEKGFNIVLVHVDMTINKSLKADDKFYVKSRFQKSGRIRVIFEQEIFSAKDNALMAKARNTVVCVSIQSGKPVMPNELVELLFSSSGG